MSFIKKMIIFLLVVIFMFGAYVTSKLFLELKVYNFMVQNYAAKTVGSDDIVIIVIDDKTVGKYRLPWKRDLNCKIFKYLTDFSSPKLIIHDAIITAPDKYNPQADKNYYAFVNSTKNFLAGFAFSSDINNYDADYDKVFNDKFLLNIEDLRTQKYDKKFSSLVKFPSDYFKALKMVGAVSTPVNLDGYLRSMPYLIPYNGEIYPSLSLRAYAYLKGIDSFVVSDNYIASKNTNFKIKRDTITDMIAAQIKFYKMRNHSSYSHKTYSAVDIMDSYDALRYGKMPEVSPAVFDGKIVFVGANVKAIATGMSDILPSPVNSRHPGVDIQATALDNLLNNETLAPISSRANFLLALGFMLVVFLLIKYNSILFAISFTGIFTLLYLYFCSYMYEHGTSIDVATPICMGVITMIFSYCHKFVLENINKEKVKSAMGKYISQDVMKTVVKNIDNLKLGGKKANVTVLFADIRGFTSISEKLSAEELSVILNEYFTEIEQVITKHNGVINKFIGDAVMVIFGEPKEDEKHAENAVICANEMLKTVKKLRNKWLNEGKPKIEIGIGINTGEVFLGNIGSEKRMEYTVIGDTVNLASRIESYNKLYKTSFLISSSTYEHVRNIADVIKISEVAIRGKAKKTTIYEVLRLIV